MSAYDRARLEDFQQRTQVRGEQLTQAEQASFARLLAADRARFESEPAPQWLGGDYPDVF